MIHHHLTVYVDPHYRSAEALHEAYRNHVRTHNKRRVDADHGHADSGFDLLAPTTIEHEHAETNNSSIIWLNHHVACVLHSRRQPDADADADASTDADAPGQPSAYYLYPRSSLAKRRLRLANSVGVIDAGYRGNLVAALDVLPGTARGATLALARDRLVQVCAPDLRPICVELAPLGASPSETARGGGGFGSTS